MTVIRFNALVVAADLEADLEVAGAAPPCQGEAWRAT